MHDLHNRINPVASFKSHSAICICGWRQGILDCRDCIPQYRRRSGGQHREATWKAVHDETV